MAKKKSHLKYIDIDIGTVSYKAHHARGPRKPLRLLYEFLKYGILRNIVPETKLYCDRSISDRKW